MNTTQTLLRWRHRAGWTQKQLAEKADIPQPNLSAYEGGTRVPTLRTLERIAEACAVSPRELWEEEHVLDLDRFELDDLARAVVTGKAPRNPVDPKAFIKLRAMFRFKLHAHGAPGALSLDPRLDPYRTKIWLESFYGHGFLNVINRRIEKYLTMGAS